MKPDLPLELARRLAGRADAAFADGSLLQSVTPVTADLLKYWFTEPYTGERGMNFHEGQRQAILNVIYLHEVLQVRTVLQMYERVAPDLLPEAGLELLAHGKYCLPKYAVKMATGTGKTWVMHALMLWQFLNALHEEEPGEHFICHFLVVAPGLIVYGRLLDAYLGRLCHPGTDERDVLTNDFHRNADLFLPPAYREEAFSFIDNNTATKEEIGRKVTGGGLIALTNWHLFLSEEEAAEEEDSPAAIVKDIRPVSPGISAGNQLDTLDRRFLRGDAMDYLAGLPELMVINDEAHHIHEHKKAGEVQEVEWQRGLDYISHAKEGRFIQLDFSATPYDMTGAGRQACKSYFPHIAADFGLAAAMRQGLVKTLLLDKRQELVELAGLDYRAVRDEQKKIIALSEGQRLMLRAGLAKLRILEEEFVRFEASKHPKMLVVCEETSVTSHVEQFLKGERLAEADILCIDSDKKGNVTEQKWNEIKECLYNVDNYASPKVIVSVLMLREGFDVNNICVIVPLRSSQSSILLEQIVGRGLRLMWREPQFQEEKTENRRRVLEKKQQPNSYLDMLSIIEHPSFERFYKELMADGTIVAGIEESELEHGKVVGDLIKVGLKPGYEEYDLYWPIVTHDAEEEIAPVQIDIATLKPFIAYSLDYLRSCLATEGETFVSQVVLTETRFGRYEVKADLFTARTYNDYLQKLLRAITIRMDRVGKRSVPLPTLQINQANIVRLLDSYIRIHLFGQPFDPFQGNDWKILLSKNAIVTQHIIKEMSVAIHCMQENVQVDEAVVDKAWFSSVPELCLRSTYSQALQKTIYERTGYPSHNGKFEKTFAEFLDADASVERFLKISENQHRFASLFYLRTDGLLASYHPDFIVCTSTHIYIIETKGDNMVTDGNVLQKRQAAAAWCQKINSLPPGDRMDRVWAYVLLPEAGFYMLARNATLEEICRLNQVSQAAAGQLF